MLEEKIKNIRELKNLTQEYMAEKLNISQTAYCKLEHGTIKISATRLNKIAEIFDLHPQDIVYFDKKKYFGGIDFFDNSKNAEYTEVKLIQRLYEAKIELLKKLLEKTEAELKIYKTKFGDIFENN